MCKLVIAHSLHVRGGIGQELLIAQHCVVCQAADRIVIRPGGDVRLNVLSGLRYRFDSGIARLNKAGELYWGKLSLRGIGERPAEECRRTVQLLLADNAVQVARVSD